MTTTKRKSKFQMTTMFIENIIICFIIGSIFPLQTTSTPIIEIAQLVGRTVSLNCPKSSSDGIIWTFNEYAPFYNGREFRGDQFKDRCRFENDSATGKQVLKISGLKPEDAGLYKCLTASDETLLQSTQLAVLDSEPTCYSNSRDNEFVGPNTCGLNQDDMRFSCAVSYHGTKASSLQWETANGHQILNDSNCERKENDTTKWINCNLTLKAEPQYDRSVFRCKVVTSNGEQYSCSTKAIKVQYFTPEEHAQEPTLKAIGNRISCSVNSSLKLNFIWMRDENNEEVVVGRNGSYVIGKDGHYHCNVFYNIKDTNCSAVVSVVYVYPTEDNTKETILAIILALAIVISFIPPIVYCISQRRRKATIQARISDAILTNGWDTVKHGILCALISGGAVGDSDYHKILGEEKGKKGIHKLVAAICRGDEKARNIFKTVMKEKIIKIDLDDASCICGKGLPHEFGGKTKVSNASRIEAPGPDTPLCEVGSRKT